MYLFFSSQKKKLALFLIAIFFLVGFFVVSQDVLAVKCDETDSNCYGLEASAPEEIKGEKDLSIVIGGVVGALLSFVGVLFFILMIYGGIIWMTASGSEEQVGKAKNLITAAVIGLIIVMSAYAITAYIGGTVGQK